MNATPRNAIPRGFLGALVAILAVEAAVARLDLDLMNHANYDWREARRAASREAPGCDLLTFGTSLTGFSVLPAVVEKRSGLRTQDMAVYAGRAAHSYYLLRHALGSGARPFAVLVDFHPTNLGSDYLMSGAWSDILGFRDCLDMAWTLGDPVSLATPVLSGVVPSIYRRNEIRGVVTAALGGVPASRRESNLMYLRNHRANKGAIVVPRNTDYRGEISEAYKGAFLGRRFRCTPEELIYIHRFLRLAASRGIRVYWLLTPLAPALQMHRENLGIDAEYTRFVRSFLGYPNLVVVDGRRSGYDHRVFLDACHLDPQGGFVFSSDLSEVLRRDRRRPPAAGGVCLTLPAYRDRPIDVPLEDALSSMLAVTRPGATRR